MDGDQQEREARKKRSEDILSVAGIPINLWLPCIETVSEVNPRPTEEIAQRAICLLIVAAKGSGEVNKRDLRMLIETYGVAGFFTGCEHSFLASRFPRKWARRQFGWRTEACWTLLWALGFVESLGLPTKQIWAAAAIEIVDKHGLEGLIANASPRPMAQILDEADLILRCHWAVRNGDMGGVPVDKLESGVTIERHYALNWLIGYCDQEWDDVSTDT